MCGHLPREFAANASTRSGYHDATASHQLTNFLGLELHRLPPEQVFDLDRAEVAHLILTDCHLAEGWHGFIIQADVADNFDDLVDANGRCRRHTKDDFVNLVSASDSFREQVRRPNHRNIPGPGVPLAGVI